MGLPKGKAEELDEQDMNWMTSGMFGLIQYAGEFYGTVLQRSKIIKVISLLLMF